jgi:hypothetical protein
MLKNIFILTLFACICSLNAQDKFITRSGNLNFEASVSSFEDIKAKNNSTTALFNVKNGEFAALVLIKGFKFKIALMEEHFNENYMESDEFPKATFKGKLQGFDVKKLDNNEQQYILEGTLTIHGIAKKIATTVSIKKITNSIMMLGSFKISPKKFNIKIPSIVKNKIAKEIIIDFNFELNPK